MKTRKHFLKFTDEMKRTVRRFIEDGQHSPKQICGRFRLCFDDLFDIKVETVMVYI